MVITIRANETGEDHTADIDGIDMANEHVEGFTIHCKYIIADYLESIQVDCSWWDSYDENDNWITGSEV